MSVGSSAQILGHLAVAGLLGASFATKWSFIQSNSPFFYTEMSLLSTKVDFPDPFKDAKRKPLGAGWAAFTGWKKCGVWKKSLDGSTTYADIAARLCNPEGLVDTSFLASARQDCGRGDVLRTTASVSAVLAAVACGAALATGGAVQTKWRVTLAFVELIFVFMTMLAQIAVATVMSFVLCVQAAPSVGLALSFAALVLSTTLLGVPYILRDAAEERAKKYANDYGAVAWNNSYYWQQGQQVP